MNAILHKRPEPVMETLALLYVDSKNEALKKVLANILGVKELERTPEDLQRDQLHADYVAAFSALRKDNEDSPFLFDEPDMGSYLLPCACFAMERDLLYQADSLSREELEDYLRAGYLFLQDANVSLFETSDKDWETFLAGSEWLRRFVDQIQKYFSSLAFLVRENIPAMESAWNQLSSRIQPYLRMQSFEDFTERSTLAVDAPVRECYPLLSIYTSSFIVNQVFYYGLFSLDHRPDEQRDNAKQLITEFCRAVGDSKRTEILFLLRERPRYNRELAKLLDLTPATATHHLDQLFRCGLIKMTTESDNQKRIYYEINQARAAQFVSLMKTLFDI